MMRLEDPAATSIDKLLASQRIIVLGSSGSGKTYLSLRLSQLLELEAIHLDKYFWKSGWVPTPQAEWRNVVTGLVGKNHWIIDGTYESTLDLRLSACDSIIVVERGPILCTWGVVKRKWTGDDLHRPDAPPGQPIDRAFLAYIWRYPFVTRPLVYRKIREQAGDKNLVVLDGARGINEFIKVITRRREGVSYSALP